MFIAFTIHVVRKLLNINLGIFLSGIGKEVCGLRNGKWDAGSVNALILFISIIAMVLYYFSSLIEKIISISFTSSQTSNSLNGVVIGLVYFFTVVIFGHYSIKSIQK